MKIRFALLILTVVSLGACQQKLQPIDGVVMDGDLEASPLVALGKILLDNNPIQVDNIITEGNSMYLSGKGFGLMRMEVGQSPTTPVLTWAVSNQLTTFPMSVGGVQQAWVYDQWASGGIAKLGNLLLTSGSYGMSGVDITETTLPREIFRTSQGVGAVDHAFVYTAMVANPNIPGVYYGVRRQDFLYTVSITNSINVLQQTSYGSNGSVCCAVDAAWFQGKLYIAFTNQLVIVSVDPSTGMVTGAKATSLLQATAIRATANHLYVVHDPASASVSSPYARGTYVFDSSLKAMALLDATPKKFALTSDDGYFYAVNASYVQIYKISW